MLKGVDVSENNGAVDMTALAGAGIDFVILRAGYGVSGIADANFIDNAKAAATAGLKIGAYWYSYALDVEGARKEARHMISLLRDATFGPGDVEMGLWFDMEDADGYKIRHGMPDSTTITAMCSAFICECNDAGYSCGIYANLDWLENQIDTHALADYVPYWVAQWGTCCDWPNARMWQYTDKLRIGRHKFDGNYYFGK